MNINKLVRTARPAPPQGWADSTAGRQVLADVLATPAADSGQVRRRIRLALLGAAGVAVLGVAGAAAVVAFGSEPPESWSVPNGSVGCAEELKAQSNLFIVRWDEGQRPVDACRKEWLRGTGKTAPDTLFGCVYRYDTGAGGAVIVVPGEQYATGAEACGSIHMYVAPDNLVPNLGSPTDPPPHQPGT